MAGSCTRRASTIRPTVLAVLHSKGGVGGSTTVWQLGAELAHAASGCGSRIWTRASICHAYSSVTRSDSRVSSSPVRQLAKPMPI